MLQSLTTNLPQLFVEISMKMSFLKSSMFLGTLVAASMMHVPSAQAFSFSKTNNNVTIETGDTNETFTAMFNGFNDDVGDIPGLTAEAIFNLIEFDGRTANFNVVLNNTSSGSTTASRVSVLGFNVTPSTGADPTATASGPLFNTVGSGNFPNNIPDLDICFKDGGGKNCAGGGGTGVKIGETGNFAFSLAFANSGTASFVLDNFAVRYQAVNSTNPALNGGSASGTGQVPTPALLPGLIGMGVAALRKKNKAELVEEVSVS